MDLGEHVRFGRPAEDGQPEGRLCDESVAAERLEGSAGRVRRELLIARDDPHLASMLDPHLRRSEDVPRRMQGDDRVAQRKPLTVGCRLHRSFDSRAQEVATGHRSQVISRSWTGVVGMSVGDDSSCDRLPRVDEKVAGRAEQSLGAQLKHVSWRELQLAMPAIVPAFSLRDPGRPGRLPGELPPREVD